MVTSKGVGLAVPDWPTTFGYNMFLFPASKWIGGIFFEHTHRLIASTVGFLTIILAAWLWFVDPRRWVRILGVAAVGAVILQGVLGGLRVTMLKDEIGIFHACLAQAFFGLVVIIALVTSRSWRAPAAVAGRGKSLRGVALTTTIFIYLQLALGATMRHQHRDLAITDFPTAYGQWIPDTSAAAIAKINAARDTIAMSDVSAAQIWLQMAHRFGAVLVADWSDLVLRFGAPRENFCRCADFPPPGSSAFCYNLLLAPGRFGATKLLTLRPRMWLWAQRSSVSARSFAHFAFVKTKRPRNFLHHDGQNLIRSLHEKHGLPAARR